MAGLPKKANRPAPAAPAAAPPAAVSFTSQVSHFNRQSALRKEYRMIARTSMPKAHAAAPPACPPRIPDGGGGGGGGDPVNYIVEHVGDCAFRLSGTIARVPMVVATRVPYYTGLPQQWTVCEEGTRLPVRYVARVKSMRGAEEGKEEDWRVITPGLPATVIQDSVNLAGCFGWKDGAKYEVCFRNSNKVRWPPPQAKRPKNANKGRKAPPAESASAGENAGGGGDAEGGGDRVGVAAQDVGASAGAGAGDAAAPQSATEDASAAMANISLQQTADGGAGAGDVVLGLARLQALAGKADDARHAGVDPARLESHLAAAAFAQVFGMAKAAFYKQPKWKQISQRKKNKLF